MPAGISSADEILLRSFGDYLKVEKGLSPLSLQAYAADVRQFADFVARGKRRLIKAQRADVGRFLQQLLGNGVDGRSVGRKLSALRQFYRFLLLDRRIEHDPTLNIESPGNGRSCPNRWHAPKLKLCCGPRRRVPGSRRH